MTIQRIFLRPHLPVFVIVFFILFYQGVHAQENIKQDAGLITADSPFAFLDTLGETISLTLTFDDEKKAEKELRYAEEKLAEAEIIMQKSNKDQTEQQETVQKALEKYENYSADAHVYVKQHAENEAFIEKVSTQTTHVIERFENVFEHAPEHIQPLIQETKILAEEQNIDTFRAYIDHHGEKGIAQATQAMREHADRVTEKLSQDGIDGMQRYRQMFEEKITERPDHAQHFSEQMLIHMQEMEQKMEERINVAKEQGILPPDLAQKASEFQNKMLETHRRSLDEIANGGRPDIAYEHYQQVIEKRVEEAKRRIDEGKVDVNVDEILRKVDDQVHLYENFRQRVTSIVEDTPVNSDEITQRAKQHREEILGKVIQYVPEEKRPVIADILKQFEEERFEEGFDVSAPRPEDLENAELEIIQKLKDAGLTDEEIAGMKAEHDRMQNDFQMKEQEEFERQFGKSWENAEQEFQRFLQDQESFFPEFQEFGIDELKRIHEGGAEFRDFRELQPEEISAPSFETEFPAHGSYEDRKPPFPDPTRDERRPDTTNIRDYPKGETGGFAPQPNRPMFVPEDGQLENFWPDSHNQEIYQPKFPMPDGAENQNELFSRPEEPSMFPKPRSQPVTEFHDQSPSENFENQPILNQGPPVTSNEVNDPSQNFFPELVPPEPTPSVMEPRESE